MLSPNQTILLDVAKAALTPMVAGVAVMIAYRQWQVASQKLVLDLFEKRFAIFTELDDALHGIMKKGRVAGEELQKIASVKIKSRFLFGRDIQKRLDNLWSDVVWQNIHSGRLELEEDSHRKKEAGARNTEVFIALHEWVNKSDAWFAPYLRLDQKLP